MGYEGGNVPKEMADCAMADILSTIIGELLLFLWCRKNLCFWTREFFRERETKERSQRDFELTFINPHNNNIIIREHECLKKSIL